MSEIFHAGLALRRQVMGQEFVDQAFAQADFFTAPLQQLITENAWGTVWARPGLDLKSRSLVTLALLAACGAQRELRGHLRGALNNGASREDIREVLLQTAVYCGIPVAAEALRTATAVCPE